MSDVDGGLLKCVLQLAACSDKLRVTDLMLGTYVDKMKKELAPSELPVLKARLAVVPVDSVPPTKSADERFQELFHIGSEAAERLEVTKMRLEKELKRRSEQFQDILSSRNNDLQEEYKRMEKDLDDQVESLTTQIADERAQQQSLKRRRNDATTQAMKRSAKRVRESVGHENKRLQNEVDSLSSEITRLQDVFSTLEAESHAMDEGSGSMASTTAEEQDEELATQVGSLRREVELLRDAKNSIAAAQTTSFKDQYEAEKVELDDDVSHLKQVTDEIEKQLGSHAKRLQALVGTLAPSSGLGALMTRLYKQLLSDTSVGPRKTVDLPGFLKSCPSVDEGKRAIEEMKKLQLIYCYESSGIIALAD